MEKGITYINEKGYVIRKSHFDLEVINEIKKELTIYPIVNKDYNPTEQTAPYKIYKENAEKLYIPVRYGIKKIGKPEQINLQEPEQMNKECNIKLRDLQKEIVEKYVTNLDTQMGGFIKAECGIGKTIIALYLSAVVLNLKTMIFVHTGVLANQWRDRIKECIPDATIGIIKGVKVDIANKDFVIVMIQSFSNLNKDFPAYTLKSYGFLIVDEAHHIGARVFSRALQRYNFKYVLGLSATPDRKDGTTAVVYHFLGDVVYDAKRGRKRMIVDMYEYVDNNRRYCGELKNYMGRPNNVKMMTNIIKHRPRNNFILSLLKKLLSENRKILILTERIQHVKELQKRIEWMIDNKEIECSVGLYIGKMKKDALEQSLKCNIIIGSYTLISEGFDCKELDTLIMATPKGDIEQIVGRIQRKEEHEIINIPLVIDVWDIFSCYKVKGYKRLKYYKSKNYDINKFEVNIDNDGNQINLITKYLTTSSIDDHEGEDDYEDDDGEPVQIVYKFD